MLFAKERATGLPVLSNVMKTENASLSSPGTSEQTPLERVSGSIGRTRSGKYTLKERLYASVSSAPPGSTKCETSAMCTPSVTRPRPALSSESASSKSRALAGSHVNMNLFLRSRRFPGSAALAPALFASFSTCEGNSARSL